MACFVVAVGLIFVLAAACGADQRREAHKHRWSGDHQLF